MCLLKANTWSFPGGSEGKASACNAGDPPNKKVENIRNYQEPVQFYRLRKRNIRHLLMRG